MRNGRYELRINSKKSKKKKPTLRIRIHNWIFHNLLKRYLITVDNSFIALFNRKAINVFPIFTDPRATEEYVRIMKILKSKRYKEYFYKAVNYKMNNPEPLVKPYGNKRMDKFLKFLAKTYVFFFDKNLYKSIEIFNLWKTKIASIDEKINSYMANTTLDERADRAMAFGIVNTNKGAAQKRLRKIQSSRVSKILAHNQE